MQPNMNSKFGVTTQLFHWVSAVVVLAAFIYGLGGSEERVYLASRTFDRNLHETLGMLVFSLTILRIIWKMLSAKPAPIDLPRWMELAAKSLQGLLYLLLLAVPLSAVAGAWLEGHAIVLLGGIQFSPPISQSHALGIKISEIHTWLGDILIWLAGAHAAAALYHHFILKDAVLISMLPDWLATMLGKKA